MLWHISMLPVLLALATLEEVVFRSGIQESLLRKGVKQGAWRRRLGPISMPNFLTALLFVVANAMLRSWAIAAFAIPEALALGWLYERYRRLWPCIAAHAAVSTLWLLLAPWFGFLQTFF